MSQLTNIPLQDNYKSTLSQAWDGNVWTIYVNTVPSFTFPSWVKTYICVDPWKTNMQVARISAYDATLKTITVDNITIDKWNGVAYTAQTHTVGSVIEISDNYQFREDILTALNTKVNTNSADTDTWKFADATARDAYFTSPVNWNSAYLTTEGKRTDYVGGAWVDRATGSTPNASTTVAGKVEKATSGEVTAWTSTGWTGAELFVWPAELKTVTDWLTTAINAKPSIASNATSSTGTNTTDAINPLQLKKYFWPEPSVWTTYTASEIVWSAWTTSSGTYTQIKIWTIERTGTYTVTFTIGTWLWSTVYGRIYKNWVAFWTERSATSTTSTFSEDLAFSEWNTISFRIKVSGAPAGMSDISIKYNLVNQNTFTLS